MLTNKDYNDINRTIGTIAHVSDTKAIPLGTILAILEFILVGIKEIFFDKMGKPKNTLQLVFSLPAIVKFASSVIKLITGKVKPTERVKALSNEPMVAKAIKQGVDYSQMKGRKLDGVSGKEIISDAEKARREASSREVVKRIKKGND